MNIEAGAKLCTGSNLERYKWKPREIADSSSPADEMGSQGIQGREAA
jgi:hypothetical protein